jgi:hypothetical protein
VSAHCFKREEYSRATVSKGKINCLFEAAYRRVFLKLLLSFKRQSSTNYRLGNLIWSYYRRCYTSYHLYYYWFLRLSLCRFFILSYSIKSLLFCLGCLSLLYNFTRKAFSCANITRVTFARAVCCYVAFSCIARPCSTWAACSRAIRSCLAWTPKGACSGVSWSCSAGAAC